MGWWSVRGAAGGAECATCPEKADTDCMAVRPDTLILTAGGLGSLVALAMDRVRRDRGDRPGKAPGLVYVHDGREAGRKQLEHARQMADYFGVVSVFDLALPHLHGPAGGLNPMRGADGTTHAPSAAPQILLAAAQLAERLGSSRIVWPVHCGEDARRQALATEQVTLVQHLREASAAVSEASWGASDDDADSFAIETPFLELTGPQLLDLGQRAEASWGLAWSCLLPGPQACRACAGCRQRRRDFDAAGLVDPIEPRPRRESRAASSRRGPSAA